MKKELAQAKSIPKQDNDIITMLGLIVSIYRDQTLLGWHVHGYKLTPFGFHIHGCVDGYKTLLHAINLELLAV